MMAFKLTKAEASARAALVDRLSAGREAVEAAISAYNDMLDTAWAAVAKSIDDYNEILFDARDFCETASADWRGEWEDKSEKWQEGERGQAAAEWIDTWEGVSLDDIDADRPDDVEAPEMEHAEELGGLPDEVE